MIAAAFTLYASCGDYLQVLEQDGLSVAVAERAAERATTWPIAVFELIVIFAAVAGFLVFRRSVPKLWLRAIVMATGVFLFELLTSPMWHNERMGWYAYLYCDVSWILTLGWTTLILGVVLAVDRWLPGWSEPKRFAAYLGILLPSIAIAEATVVALGIRSYSIEVQQALTGITMAGVPIEILYYAPVFTSLVIAFYKYWSFVINDVAMVPVKHRRWVRAVGLAFVAVFFFELLVEPVVVNQGFPSWSYVYRDISFLYTAVRVLVIAIGAVVVDRFMLGMPLPARFVVGVLVISACYLPFEAWFIDNGYRVFGETAVANQTGITSPVTGLPVEIVFAVPCYMSLIVCFIRYWEIVFDNDL